MAKGLLSVFVVLLVAEGYVSQPTCTYTRTNDKTGSPAGPSIIASDITSCESICTGNSTCVALEFTIPSCYLFTAVPALTPLSGRTYALQSCITAVTPNTFGGACTQGPDTCSAPNEECSAASGGTCVCKTGYTGSIGGACAVTPNTFGGACTQGPDTCSAPNEECSAASGGTCVCKTGYTGSIGGACAVTPNTFGEACTQGPDTCSAPNEECSAASGGTCVCKTGYTGSIGGACAVMPNTFGGACTQGPDTCSAPNEECSAASGGTCVCKTGYTGSNGGACVADLCTGGWSTLSFIGASSCYQEGAVARNWMDARSNCLDMGGDIVQIDSPAEFAALISTGEYWAGVYYNDANEFVNVDGTSAKNSLSIPSGCQTSGRCVKIGGSGAQCFPCTEDHAYFCERPMDSTAMSLTSGQCLINTTCTASGMTVTARTSPDFAGLIYAMDHADNESCRLTATDLGVFSRDFSLGECGLGLQQVDGSFVSSVTILAQFNRGVIIDTDQKHMSSCTYDNELVVSGILGTVNLTLDDLQQSNSTASGDASSLVTLAIQDANDLTLDASNTVAVGDLMALKIGMKANSVFTTMLVTSCRVSNKDSRTAEGYVWLPVVDAQGCPADSSLVADTGSYASDPIVDYSLQVTAFLFTEARDGDNNQLHYSCQVRLCPDGDGGCAEPTCGPITRKRRRSVDESSRLTAVHLTGALSTAGRERQAADQEVTEVKATVGVILTREDSSGNTGGDNDGQLADPDLCVKSPKVQSVIVSLGVVLIALVIFIAVLTFLLCRRHRRRGEGQDKLESYGETPSMGIPMGNPEYFPSHRPKAAHR